VSEEANKNVPARNTLVQLLAMYTNPEADSHNTQRYRQTDRQTDRRHHDSSCDHAVKLFLSFSTTEW